MLFLFFFLGSSQVKYNPQHPTLFLTDLSDLIIEHDIIIFQAVDSFKVDTHAIPCHLFELFGDDLVFQDFLATLFSNSQTFSKYQDKYSCPILSIRSRDSKSTANSSLVNL